LCFLCSNRAFRVVWPRGTSSNRSAAIELVGTGARPTSRSTPRVVLRPRPMAVRRSAPAGGFLHAPCIVRLPIDVQHTSRPPSLSASACVHHPRAERSLLKMSVESPLKPPGDSDVFSRRVLIILITLVLVAHVHSIFFHLPRVRFTLQQPPGPVPPPNTAPDLLILQSRHRNPTRAPSLPHIHHCFGLAPLIQVRSNLTWALYGYESLSAHMCVSQKMCGDHQGHYCRGLGNWQELAQELAGTGNDARAGNCRNRQEPVGTGT
jgi:hypothetical protein